MAANISDSRGRGGTGASRRQTSPEDAGTRALIDGRGSLGKLLNQIFVAFAREAKAGYGLDVCCVTPDGEMRECLP